MRKSPNDTLQYAAGYSAGRRRATVDLTAEMVEVRQRGANFRLPGGRQAQLVLPDDTTPEEVAFFREMIMLYMQRLEQMLATQALAKPEQPDAAPMPPAYISAPNATHATHGKDAA